MRLVKASLKQHLPDAVDSFFRTLSFLSHPFCEALVTVCKEFRKTNGISKLRSTVAL